MIRRAATDYSCRYHLPYSGGARKTRISAAATVYAVGMLPPLNQTLWMLLVVSLIVAACLGALYLLGAAHRNAELKRRSDLFSRPRPRPRGRRLRARADQSAPETVIGKDGNQTLPRLE